MADDVNQSCSSERLGDGDCEGEAGTCLHKTSSLCSNVQRSEETYLQHLSHLLNLTFICSCPDVMRPGSLVVAVVVVAAAAGVVAR